MPFKPPPPSEQAHTHHPWVLHTVLHRTYYISSFPAVHNYDSKPVLCPPCLPSFPGREQLQDYKGRPQLTCSVSSSQWIVIRNKQMAREIFQKVPPPRSRSSCSTPAGTGDDVEDLEPDDDDDSLHEVLLSGPDAGGGGASRVLPREEWKVVASSFNYTMDDQDRDRCVSHSPICRALQCMSYSTVCIVLYRVYYALQCMSYSAVRVTL